MRRPLAALAATTLLAPAALAQTPKEQLAKPPADARHFVIQSTGGKHGDSWRWTTADGTHLARESMNLRGQVWEMDYRGVPGPDGLPQTVEIRGVSPQGDVAETFGRGGAGARWKSPIDKGTTAAAAGKYYTTTGGPIEANAWFVERLLASPTKTLQLLPGGEARAAKLTDLAVGAGPTRRTVTLWSITGVGTSPLPIWADADNRFFAVSFGLAWLPADYAGEQKRLEEAQAAALAGESERIARTLPKTPKGAVAFTNVRLFDADALAFRDGQTVVVSGGKIAAVGPAAQVKVPAGAQLFPGKGMTLVPGLWDVHMHVGDDYTGPQELSIGVTSIRDPGNDDRRTLDRRARAAAGKLLFPNVYASSLIDGKGPYAAQVANVATSQEEAIALVRRAKANGFHGVKFYGTFNKDWLPAAVAEAHRLGLHVHGHVPVGLRPLDAIRTGYDELTHINWVVMQGVPDSVIGVSNGIARFEGPGRYAKDLDVDGPALGALIDAMAAKRAYSDPTMTAFESLYVPEPGDLSPSYAPFVGTMPPTTERQFRTGGFAVPNDLTRADYRASWAKMVALLGRMKKAGIAVAAGTDGSGLELIRELEVYREGGFTPAEALAAATIVPARLVGQDATTGSIKVGKTADLVLVEGDPERRIGDLRQTRVVMLGGKLLDADALRTAAGFSGRPK